MSNAWKYSAARKMAAVKCARHQHIPRLKMSLTCSSAAKA